MKVRKAPEQQQQTQGNTRHDSFKASQARQTHAADTGIYPLHIYYESACALCNAEMTNLMLRNTEGLLVFVDISAPGFDDLPAGTQMQDLLELLHGRRADGTVIKGVEVFRLIYQAVGLGWMSSVLRLPVLGSLAEKTYPLLARNRHRIPRALVGLMFEGPARRAAEQAAARKMYCAPGDSCRL